MDRTLGSVPAGPPPGPAPGTAPGTGLGLGLGLGADLAARFPLGAAVTADGLAGDPHALLTRPRATEPVSWLPALGGRLVTLSLGLVFRKPAAPWVRWTG